MKDKHFFMEDKIYVGETKDKINFDELCQLYGESWSFFMQNQLSKYIKKLHWTKRRKLKKALSNLDFNINTGPDKVSMIMEGKMLCSIPLRDLMIKR